MLLSPELFAESSYVFEPAQVELVKSFFMYLFLLYGFDNANEDIKIKFYISVGKIKLEFH